jgi:hypothetical protein
MKRTRRQLRKRRTRKQKGGSNATATTSSSNSTANATPQTPKVDCQKEGFDLEMRYATFGSNYKKDVSHIHLDGEKWSFDKLKDFTMDGRIVDWYIEELDKQGIKYTSTEIEKLKKNETLAILGAFFHRYKVVAEKVGHARVNLNKGVSHFFIAPQFKDYTGKHSYKTYLKANKNEKFHKMFIERHKESLEKLARFVDIDIEAKDLPIENAIDKAQCLMYYIVKHKGEVPPGFVMDPRIERRAKEEIHINTFPDSLQGAGAVKLDPTLKWLVFVEEAFNELNDPPVTFNVF